MCTVSGKLSFILAGRFLAALMEPGYAPPMRGGAPPMLRGALTTEGTTCPAGRFFAAVAVLEPGDEPPMPRGAPPMLRAGRFLTTE